MKNAKKKKKKKKKQTNKQKLKQKTNTQVTWKPINSFIYNLLQNIHRQNVLNAILGHKYDSNQSDSFVSNEWSQNL